MTIGKAVRVVCPCGLGSVEGAAGLVGVQLPSVQCLGCGRAFDIPAMTWDADAPEGYVRPSLEGGTLVEHVGFTVRYRRARRRGLRATLHGIVYCTVCGARVSTPPVSAAYRTRTLTIKAGRLAELSKCIRHQGWCP